MKIKGNGLDEGVLRTIAAGLGLKLENVRTQGRYTCFVLRMATCIGRGGWRKALPEAIKYRKRGYSAHMRGSDAFGGNGAVCFHGHKAFMEEVFKIDQDAVIRTAVAAYLGKGSFEAQWPAVENRNVGSQMYPQYYGDACACEE